jgi:DNA-directed RNA polymerase subunit RPC12/RpoP
MQKGHTLEFKCLSCGTPVVFSIFDLDSHNTVRCHDCEKKYAFTDATLIRQIKKFEALCRQIQDSEEILGAANVGVDVGEHHVKVPYKLLLTRLSSSLNLKMAGQDVSIFFRIEPSRDLPAPNTPVQTF